MSEHTETQAKKKNPPLADQGAPRPAPKQRKLKKPIRDLRLSEIKGLGDYGLETRIKIPVGSREGVHAGVQGRLDQLHGSTFTIEKYDDDTSWATVDLPVQTVLTWHKVGGRVVIGE